MKQDDTGRDRLIDSLLREDARGGADEELLAEVEKAIDTAADGGARETERRGAARPWAWGIAAAACVGAVVGYQVFFPKGEDRGMAARTGQAQEQEQERMAWSQRSKKPGAPVASRPKGDAYLEAQRAGDPDADPPALREGLVSPSPTTPGKDPATPATRAHVTAGPTPEAVPGSRNPDSAIARNEEQQNLSLVQIRGGVFSSGREGRRTDGFFGYDEVPAGVGRIRGRGLDHEADSLDRERYGQLVDQPWNTPWQAPLSTFSVDVDTASYTNIRRLLRSGATIPKDAVRIEECINYFDYAYPAPVNGGPFAVHVESASCPWQTKHHLVKIGLKGKEVGTNERPPSNLVFLIDVSGSMNSPDKLPLLIESMKILVEELDERDSVGIVVYASAAGTVLEPTKVVGQGRTEILSALDSLRAGGSTAGAAGITGAYELAAKHYNKDGVNRVILATDGDFNVGTSGTGALVDLVKEKSRAGIFLSVLGFGTGNLNDEMMEAITNDGNGNFFYIDSQREGRKVFLQDLSGTLVTIAKDVKIQLEFNPGKVAAYRLIGYANRILPPEAFNDDKIDAGDIGAGHTVTALYEIVPVGVAVPTIGGVDPLKYQKPANRAAVDSPEWMTVKLRYKAPDGEKSSLIELPVKDQPQEWTKATGDLQFATAVALFGEKLRGSDKIDDAGWEMVMDLAKRGSGRDPHGHRAEFRELVTLAGRLRVEPRADVPPVPVPALEAPKAE